MVLPDDKDITIKDGDAIYYFSYLYWDSDFFNRSSYYLNVDLSHLDGINNTIEDQIRSQFNGCFVTAKIDTSFDNKILKKLQNSGFYYIETELTLEYQKNQPSHELKKINQSIDIINQKFNKELPYSELGSAFTLTRFHTDSCISNKLADNLWISYLKNYRPDEKHHMILAKYKDQIAGTILANRSGNEVILFFVAIRKEFRGKGIGSALLKYIVDFFDNRKIITGSQIKNIPALNYYIKNGFSKIISTKTVFHRWSD